MSRIVKRPHRSVDGDEERSDQELVEDTADDTPAENAADTTVAEAAMVEAPEDRVARPRKRRATERR